MVIFRDYEPYLHKILQGGITGIVLTLVANERSLEVSGSALFTQSFLQSVNLLC